MASTLTTNFAPFQIPLEDVQKATDNFHHDNLITKGGSGSAYSGQLLVSGNLMKIVALRLDRKLGVRDIEFWNEISMLSDLKHTNLVSFIGFCDEKNEKIIVIRQEANGSLVKHLNGPNLTSWARRLRISIGVARALSYLHHGHKRSYGVIHRNINSFTILLDENWEPKLSGFTFSIKQPVNRMDQVVPCEPIGISGYMDPEIEKIKGASSKSDIYSFGVVLFEILCGRTAYIQNEANTFLAPLAKDHYENKTLQDIIHSDLWNHMSPFSLVKYSETAYSCLKEEGERRPRIEYVVAQLEKALELQLQRENIINNWRHLMIPHKNVESETNNFSETCRIRSSEYFNLYRAELNLFDIEGSSSTAAKNNGEHPDRPNTVAIKHIISREDGQDEEYFYNNIGKLTSVKHPNIVALLGFCVEGSDMILVIENFCNGYLDDYLANHNSGWSFATRKREENLPWEKRLQICIDVARALNYLHCEKSSKNTSSNKKIILNRDIGRHTIGLDENWRAKIIEFGFSVYLPSDLRIEGLYSKNRGRVCYSDPYDTVRFLRVEADVYSFGVVLYEMLCGRIADCPIYLRESEKGLAHVANKAYSKGTLEKMIDPLIQMRIGQKNFDRPLFEFDCIAGRCVSATIILRPSMEEVVKQLESQLENALRVKKLFSQIKQFKEAYYQARIREIHEKSKQVSHGILSKMKSGLVGGSSHESLFQKMLHKNEKELAGIRSNEISRQVSSGILSKMKSGLMCGSSQESPWQWSLIHKYENELLGLLDHDYKPEPVSGSLLQNMKSLMFGGSSQKSTVQKPNQPIMGYAGRDIVELIQLEDAEEFAKGDLEAWLIKHGIRESKSKLLKIRLGDIKLATDNFSETYMIASNSYYNLYRAELYHYDIENPSSVKGENKGKHPERQNIVTIKRFLTNRRDEMFFTSIDMLTSVKHRNIVTLLGLCVEDLEMILITENFCNGYLEDYLININNRHILTWEKRLKICIDIAHALKYLHYEVEDPKKIINCDICSYTIGLDENWGAKIVEFGNSVLLEKKRSIHPNIVAKECYIDPQVRRGDNLTRESDVYSLGIVLFEILSGTVAYDPIYFERGLAQHARTSFYAGTLDDMIDPKIKDDVGENSFILNRGPNKNSLKTFIKIALDCVKKTTKQRPTIEVVVKQLEKALYFQENTDHKISLEKIKHATQKFHNDHYIGGGGFGRVYKGNLQDGDELKIVAVKRLDTRHGQGEQQFLSELQILFEYKHENIVGLVGYCDEEDEKIIVYEYASGGSLDKYLNNDSLTWEKRLDICIEVARALDFLHGGKGKQAKVLHRDIKTANILLSHDGKAKLADFGLSLISPITQETDVVVDNVCGTPGYLDPLYRESKFLTIESDIYSFGVVLFEMLYGRSTFAIHKHEGHYLPDFVKSKFEEGKLDEVVFEPIKEQIAQESLTAFQKIAYQCLQHERENRPTTKTVLAKLMKALKFQNPKSPKLERNIIEEALFEYASLLHS